MNVFLLATCRKPELAPMTELVFTTLRIGFPKANVTVSLNGDCEKQCPGIREAADRSGCLVESRHETIHHKWIEDLIESQREPFWICDTDIIFYSKVEDWEFETALAGWRIPEFFDKFTGTITRARLHGSLLYIDPVKVKQAVSDYYTTLFEETPFNPRVNLVHPLCLPFNGQAYFYDTMGLLYHAIGGTKFTAEQLDSYFHFFFGTLSDMVIPRLLK